MITWNLPWKKITILIFIATRVSCRCFKILFAISIISNYSLYFIVIIVVKPRHFHFYVLYILCIFSTSPHPSLPRQVWLWGTLLTFIIHGDIHTGFSTLVVPIFVTLTSICVVPSSCLLTIDALTTRSTKGGEIFLLTVKIGKFLKLASLYWAKDLAGLIWLCVAIILISLDNRHIKSNYWAGHGLITLCVRCLVFLAGYRITGIPSENKKMTWLA